MGEGLDLLEHTLQERLTHRSSLASTHERWIAQLQDDLERERRMESVVAEVSVDREGQYLIELSYRLSRAKWLPVYQARIEDEIFNLCGTKPRVNARVHLEMSARYLQATSEDWPNCKAEFSLYPPSIAQFPILNFPANESLTIESTRPRDPSNLTLDTELHSPWASLCHLFRSGEPKFHSGARPIEPTATS